MFAVLVNKVVFDARVRPFTAHENARVEIAAKIALCSRWLIADSLSPPRSSPLSLASFQSIVVCRLHALVT